MAYHWQDQGATHLHIVDLNGAKEGRPVHLSVVEKIAKKTSLILELGGGLRTLDNLQSCINAGVHYPIVGTQALADPSFLEKAQKLFPQNIVVGIDSKDGCVATEGWLQQSSTTAVDLAKRMDAMGITRMICTDIKTDGALNGPNLDLHSDLLEKTQQIATTVSGGITTVSDVKKIVALKNPRIFGIIVGKALYDKRITLFEIFALC